MRKVKDLIPPFCNTLCWLVWAVTIVSPTMAQAAIASGTRRWTPGIGDPTIYGWFTVLAYLVAAGLLLANLKLAKRLGLGMYFWLAAGLLMLFLGINKQLDLQTWFTQVGRDLAKVQGWYDNRRIVQAGFIGLLLISGVVATWAMLCQSGRAWREYRLCGIGLIMTVVFIIVRAASFHHVDKMLGLSFAGLPLNVVLELGGIALVLVGAASWRSGARKRASLLRRQRRAKFGVKA